MSDIGRMFRAMEVERTKRKLNIAVVVVIVLLASVLLLSYLL